MQSHSRDNRFRSTFRALPAVAALAALAAGVLVAPAALAAPPAITASDDVSEPAAISAILPVELPEGAKRSRVKAAIDQFRAFITDAAKGRGRAVTDVELLLWQPGGAAKKALPGVIRAAGFDYQQGETAKVDGGSATEIIVTHKKSGREVAGMWLEKDGNALLAWGRLEAAAGGRAAAESPKPAGGEVPARAGAGAPVTVEVDAQTFTVNVMGRAAPTVPAFPEVAKKPGTVRGYVYDANGKPLKGARIGVRSTQTGGFYSGAAADTDEKGFYEIQVPWGAAHFYAAGYAVDYGEGRAALGLHPADGDAGQFASTNGAVENFVLAAWGVADRAGVQENPKYCNNYFGGNIVLSWYVDDDARFPQPTALPRGSTIELTLTPEGPLTDGSPGRTIVVRKRVESSALGQLYLNNIPVGAYRISARLGGAPLKMKEVGPNGGKMFGISPKQAVGNAEFLVRPASARLENAGAGRGNWDHVSIALERP